MKEQLKELAQLTRQHLCEEYDESEWLLTDQQSYDYFRKMAKKSSPPPPAKPTPVKKFMPCVPEQPKKASPPPEPKAPVPVKQVKESIQLETKRTQEAPELSSQLDLIRRVCPKINLIEEIPQPKNDYVQFYSVSSDGVQRAFWTKVITALEDRGVECRRIDCENQEQLIESLKDLANIRLLLVPRKYLPDLKELSYRQHPSTMKHYIQNVPLIALEDVSLYETDLSLKRMLWQNLRSELNI